MLKRSTPRIAVFANPQGQVAARSNTGALRVEHALLLAGLAATLTGLTMIVGTVTWPVTASAARHPEAAPEASRRHRTDNLHNGGFIDHSVVLGMPDLPPTDAGASIAAYGF